MKKTNRDTRNMGRETSKLLNPQQPQPQQQQQQHCSVEMFDITDTVDTDKQTVNSSKVDSHLTPTEKTVVKPQVQNARTPSAIKTSSCDQTSITIEPNEDQSLLQPEGDEGETDRARIKDTKSRYLDPTASKSPDIPTKKPLHGAEDEDETSEVVFLVGQERQPMTARKSQLTAVSPVFCAMFADRWRATKTDSTAQVVEIPDVDVNAFAEILKFSQGEVLRLTEENVWHVLKTADMYEVSSAVDQCFHFLLHNHPRCHRIRHICIVLEQAHELNYNIHHENCMNILVNNIGKVFRKPSALSELCQRCMLHLIQSEDLAMPEICIHDAVVTWAYRACAKRGESTPSLESLREVAGDLVHHVRYLNMPQRSLKNLANRGGQISCLLTETELNKLLNGDVGAFPETVNIARQINQPNILLCCSKKKPEGLCSMLFLFGLFALLIFAIIYVPIMLAFTSSQDDVLNDR